MSALDDPRYKVLAMRAAAILGTTSPYIINAIIAQWRCEIGGNDEYPPKRNNPGNLTEDAAKSINRTYTVPDAATNPQPSNPIVTFSTPEYGADSYGILLDTLPRYSAVRDAVAANDPEAFFEAIKSSGYGTSLTCMQSVYRDPANDAPVSIGEAPTGAKGWVECQQVARVWYVDSAGILRPIDRPTPSAFTFQAWVSSAAIKTWAPGPKSTLRYEATFRKILGPVHTGQYLRMSDQGITFHDY